MLRNNARLCAWHMADRVRDGLRACACVCVRACVCAWTRHVTQIVCMQGDGAWEPRSGERGAPLVAHGTRQNQYTKRRALLNGAGNNTSSNNDSDDNVGSSEDRRHRDGQHGHCADTGFTAEAAALGNAQSKDDLLAAQNPSSSQIRAEGAQPVGESGVLGRLEKSESSGLKAKSRAEKRAVAHASSGDSNKGRRHNLKNLEPELGDGGSDPQEADTSSGDDAVPMDIARDARSDEKAEGTAGQDARAAQDHPAKSSDSMDDQRSSNPSKDVGAQEATARTDRHSQKDKHPHRVKPSAVVEPTADGDSALLEDSGVKDEAHTSSADENRDAGSNVPKPAVNQAAKASKAPKSSSAAVRAAAATDTALKAAASSGMPSMTACTACCILHCMQHVLSSPFVMMSTWAAWCTTWLLINLMPTGVVFSFLSQ